MKTLKQIWAFITAKILTFTTKNVTVEDQYTGAAERIINEITRLRTAHVKSIKEEKRLRSLAEEKTNLAVKKENEIRGLLKKGVNVESHGKLGILYRRTSEALTKKADEFVGMRSEIEVATVRLNDQLNDLQVKLEFIRETKAANELGVASAEDVVEAAALVDIDVSEVLTRVNTFTGDKVTQVSDIEVQDYIDSLSK
ncbi:hypothetical protein [Aeromonas phage AS-yj]|uniref:Host specificity protein n=6 Tax=Caudoviricetes TaxID=2731619 RepID=A0A291LF05_9CAUD|nr:hypothetical protein F485_gp182 [Aeromonas phage CC2]YP_009834469.1 hypothetical protein HWB28_gp169 [Aeromonas phage AS-zj]YP_009835107.1 hypothetical protein HWB29_gp405 [Aeromonas phage AS-sw]ATI17613.1 hypothetical protein [Aeromonas phage AS-szw]ATI17894.1 hypothetical protein [Aeromonas phage AS-yj]QMV28813.1 hypothetical protein AP1_0106 [Aeromonas phage AP1]UKM62682.1 hypothetical protein P19_0194 [Aeromonas phage P19]AFN39471.1 hypothetical protein CC2_113 [Aeromonas phage CC2]